MSDTARTDEIDDVLSSVRDFVAHKDLQKVKQHDRLMLTPELRVAEDAEVKFEVEPALVIDAGNVHTLEPTLTEPDAEGLEATIAELEAAVTAQSDNWEPDGGEAFAETETWAASAFEAPIKATQENEAGNAAQNAPFDVDAFEARIAARLASGLDEEELRALVVATVQDQLSGELGERITRNVRKLVRREINRVLASRELGEG